jgi:5-(carboxyamino)imidazole ribonucleotide synthase
MANLLGEIWDAGEPAWDQSLQSGRTALHLYGKLAARPGRKMGHLTAWGDDWQHAAIAVRTARERLSRRG